MKVFITHKILTLIPQKVLFSLGGSFLYYADRFKLYSAFCASHTKVPKVLAKGKIREKLLAAPLMGAHGNKINGSNPLYLVWHGVDP